MFLFVPPFPASLVGNNFGLVFRVRVAGAFRYRSTVILQSLFWIMLFQCWALYEVFKQMIECRTFISWCVFNLRQAVKRRKHRCIRNKQHAKSNPGQDLYLIFGRMVLSELNRGLLTCCKILQVQFVVSLPEKTGIHQVIQLLYSLTRSDGIQCVVVEALTQHGMVPISPPSIHQALDNIHMMWMGTWINHNAVTNTCVNPDVGSPLKFYITTGWQRMTLWSGWGWLLPKMEWIPHPLPTYERYLTTFIFCGWNLHHVTTTTCVRPDVGSPIKSCITPGLQRIPLCSGWGSYPRWKESHMPSQHMKGVWKPSYAVDGHMNLS